MVKGTKYDRSHFIVTTDGCKDGFAGVLAQRFEWVDTKGNLHPQIHPIAFTSKRTSDSESRYQPYLLEFVALKHSLDKFLDAIGGYLVDMGHHIVDCCHCPGKQNQAADGLSRQFTDTPKCKGDSH